MMKFQIREGVNKYDGSPMFNVYEWDENLQRWSYRSGSGKIEEARAYVDRIIHPQPERVVAEIEFTGQAEVVQ